MADLRTGLKTGLATYRGGKAVREERRKLLEELLKEERGRAWEAQKAMLPYQYPKAPSALDQAQINMLNMILGISPEGVPSGEGLPSGISPDIDFDIGQFKFGGLTLAPSGTRIKKEETAAQKLAREQKEKEEKLTRESTSKTIKEYHDTKDLPTKLTMYPMYSEAVKFLHKTIVPKTPAFVGEIIGQLRLGKKRGAYKYRQGAIDALKRLGFTEPLPQAFHAFLSTIPLEPTLGEKMPWRPGIQERQLPIYGE